MRRLNKCKQIIQVTENEKHSIEKKPKLNLQINIDCMLIIGLDILMIGIYLFYYFRLLVYIFSYLRSYL